MNYWVICRPMNGECGHKWIALPATEENLTCVVEMAKMGSGPVYIAEEKERK